MEQRGVRRPDRSDEWTLFESAAVWQDEGTPALDVETGLPVLAEDHDRAYWVAHGHGGDGRIGCLDCWAGSVPGVAPRTLVPLTYREPSDRRAHFAHPAGTAHESVGGPGESMWHLRAKRLLQDWAAGQLTTAQVDLEWITVDGSRRADVRVATTAGVTLALEAQQRGLRPSDWRARRASYAALGVRDFWFWPTTVRRPEITSDGWTSFAIDPERQLLGLIVSLWPSRLEAGMKLAWPPLQSKPFAALWAPMDEWLLTDGRVVPPARLIARCHPVVGPGPRLGPAVRSYGRHAPRRGSPALNGPAQAAGDTRKTCTGCGWVLDPIWHAAGRHLGC